MVGSSTQLRRHKVLRLEAAFQGLRVSACHSHCACCTRLLEKKLLYLLSAKFARVYASPRLRVGNRFADVLNDVLRLVHDVLRNSCQKPAAPDSTSVHLAAGLTYCWLLCSILQSIPYITSCYDGASLLRCNLQNVDLHAKGRMMGMQVQELWRCH